MVGGLLEVEGGSGWPPMASKLVGKWPSHPATRNRARLLWAFVGALVGVLVAAHGGGVRGCLAEQVVVVGGRKAARKRVQQGRGQRRLVGETILSEHLRILLARLSQRMSVVL